MLLKYFFLFLAFIFFLIPSSKCQTLIKSDDRGSILLNSDGTWNNVKIAKLEDGTEVALKDDGRYLFINASIKVVENSEGISFGDEGIGTGQYDDSGNGIFGRRVTYVSRAKLAGVKAGVAVGDNKKIWIKTCINQAGKVTYVEIDEDNTDVIDNAVLKKALSMVSGYEFEKNINAPLEQCGVVKIRIDRTNNLIGNE